MHNALRVTGFLCIALWLIFMIGDWTNTLSTEALFGVARHWVTLPLLVISMLSFWVGNRRKPPVD